MRMVHVILAVLLTVAMQGGLQAAVGYVTITNYAGFLIPGAAPIGMDPGPPGWTSSYPGISDFENNASYYVRSNTSAIQASLRTDPLTDNRTLQFAISAPGILGSSYTELATTNATVNGHRYTAARFDWSISLPGGSSTRYVRLKLCPSWSGIDDPYFWAVQPGPGVHSGHAEVYGFDTWDIGFQVAFVDELLVPEPSTLVTLLGGLGFLGMLTLRKH